MIGGKYKPLLLYYLEANKVLRFGQLRQLVTSASKKMLTQQLRELEADDLVHRKVFKVVPPKVEYSLTERGKSLQPVLKEMGLWGHGTRGITVRASGIGKTKPTQILLRPERDPLKAGTPIRKRFKRVKEGASRGACPACEAVVSKETSSQHVLPSAALYCLAIGTGTTFADESASDPSPQLHRSDTERRQTVCR